MKFDIYRRQYTAFANVKYYPFATMKINQNYIGYPNRYLAEKIMDMQPLSFHFWETCERMISRIHNNISDSLKASTVVRVAIKVFRESKV